MWVVFEGQASHSIGLVGSLLWGVVDCFVKCLLRTVMLSHAILLVSVENQVCLSNLYGSVCLSVCMNIYVSFHV